jgi:uncharacterized damage-inducible protein DinB
MNKLISEYQQGIALLREVLNSLSGEQLTARPVAGKWSMLETLCHLADAEMLFAGRMKRVLCEELPHFELADPTHVAERLACHHREPSEEMAIIELVRQQMVRILVAQPAEAWSRVGVHSVAGPQTLEQLVSKAVTHLEHHLGFMREKRQVLMATRPPLHA